MFCAGASDPSITGWTDALREVHSLVGGSLSGLRQRFFVVLMFWFLLVCADFTFLFSQVLLILDHRLDRRTARGSFFGRRFVSGLRC